MDRIKKFLILFLLLATADSKDYTFTFSVPAGARQCFHEIVDNNFYFELEYQVIDGGELDIDFQLLGPTNELLGSDYRQMDGHHAVEVVNNGEYTFCFDNSFSRMSAKLVYIDVIIENTNEDSAYEESIISPNSIVLDMKVQDLRVLLTNMTNHLNKVAVLQQFFTAREARHRHSLEGSNSRVLWWSLTNCILVIAVGILQVCLVRNLFRIKRKDKITT